MRKSLLLISLLLVVSRVHAADAWKAGVATVDITPEGSLWMSGYGNRDRPASGKLTSLWAKSLALEDPQGNRALLITLDLVGIDRSTSLEICRRIAKAHGLGRDGIVLSTSHTHSGPVVGRNLEAMYFISEEQWAALDRYAEKLIDQVVEIAGASIERLRASQIAFGNGKATFAANRRNNPEKKVPELRAAGQLKGPVDHDVHVLKVLQGDKLLVAVTGYACHCTVLSGYEWCGDYAGYYQIELEKRHSGATAMFWAGCGADINPLPRRRVEHAKEYGKRLAAAADAVLRGPMRSIEGTLGAVYQEIDLAFDELPTRAQIEKDRGSDNRYIASRAKHLLARIARDGALDATYPYPVQTWRLGRELLFISLGGEVCVDFSIRFKRELGRHTTWVAGYSNDVMAYIPSLRVLKEGGYEGESAMIYYGLPTRWSTDVEEHIVRTVHEQVKRVRP